METGIKTEFLTKDMDGYFVREIISNLNVNAGHPVRMPGIFFIQDPTYYAVQVSLHSKILFPLAFY
jgi:hypothetical protein